MSVIPNKPSAKSQVLPPNLPQISADQSIARRTQAPAAGGGTPVPDSKAELPPVIRRPEVVAIALVGLLIICIIAGLYLAKAFFLPITMAFIVGTMLSPAAGFLERYRIPRAVSAVLIVAAAGAGAVFMVGLIASPAVMEWSGKLPELGALLKEKLHVFDRPLALWQELQSMLGGSDTLATLHLPKIDWVQPTLEFLSPTFAEFLLFVATLILFIASWRELRRALIMNFGERESRLRTLRILNEIEEHLGSYLLMVTMINVGVGVVTGLICAVTGMPNPAGLGALAAILNFIPIIGPVAMFAVLVVVGLVAFPTLGAGLLAPTLFAAMTFLEGHFLTPMIVGRRLAAERARGIHRAGVLDLAVGTDGRVPVVAAPDRRADRQGASDAGRFAAACQKVCIWNFPFGAGVSAPYGSFFDDLRTISPEEH